jgi:hypothetical protein
MKSLLIVFITLAAFFSCKNSKQTTQTSLSSATTNSTMTNIEPTKELPDSLYRVVVSFISIGEGTDAKAKEELDALTGNYKTKNGAPIEREEFRWGREGEVDYCYKMQGYSKKEKDNFVNLLREKFAGNKLVQIEENTICMHKR